MKVQRTVMGKATRVVMKAQKSFMIEGHVVRPGDIVEVSEFESWEFKHRGIATPATDEEFAAAKGMVISRTVDDPDSLIVSSSRMLG